MENRRNYYRILRIQPDASHNVVVQSYRSLMQKLRLHPDLGGEENNAGIVNQAYATLRDPKKRLAYDVELLDRYNIKTLSAGGVVGPDVKPSDAVDPARDDDNKRNYYRVLQVQPDAELEVIKASYRALAKSLPGEDLLLLEQAFSIVGDPRLRAEYDGLRGTHVHAASIEKLKDLQNSKNDSVDGAETPAATKNCSGTADGALQTTVTTPYRAAIIHYCRFCKTPHSGGGMIEPERFCRECASPLFSPAEAFIDTARRSLTRMQQSDEVRCYEFWPAAPVRGALQDLSPAGLKFSTSQALDVGQIVKLDGSNFKAVAEVVFCNATGAGNQVGAKFLAVEFERETGNFVSLSA